MTVQHKFVDFMPDIIEDGVLYISLDYGTVIHNCACGCGNEVNTPLSPTAWKMIYNGESISLKPSIGNWSFDCKSHYWITNNKIKWSVKWDDETIRKVRNHEDYEREEYYKKINFEDFQNKEEELTKVGSETENKNWIQRLFFWW
jgi:hypothetical protein